MATINDEQWSILGGDREEVTVRKVKHVNEFFLGGVVKDSQLFEGFAAFGRNALEG